MILNYILIYFDIYEKPYPGRGVDLPNRRENLSPSTLDWLEFLLDLNLLTFLRFVEISVAPWRTFNAHFTSSVRYFHRCTLLEVTWYGWRSRQACLKHPLL